jgi:hypothetical protein
VTNNFTVPQSRTPEKDQMFYDLYATVKLKATLGRIRARKRQK